MFFRGIEMFKHQSCLLDREAFKEITFDEVD